MRRRYAGLLAMGLAVALAVASSATPQDSAGAQAHFWPHRTFYIPVNVERINQTDPKPSHLQLYSSLNRGPWQAGKKLPLNDLQNLGDGKRGFQFTADRDGEYEFSVQYWYSDGSASPKRPDELAAMLSVVIDTTPPQVRISAGANGVQWQATDDNLDSRYVTLQAKYPGWTEWRNVTDRQMKPADSYAWQLKPGQVLEVRVLARDRAGNDGFSPVVRVPVDAAVGTAFPKGSAPGPDWVGGTGRDPLTPAGGHVPQPRIEYVNGKDITVDYTIQRMGRSGIKSARLYVLREKDPRGWEQAGEFTVNLQPDNRDQTLSLKYTAKEEGVYGFYVAPESGAGLKADPPRKDDPPMQFVVVDWTQPYVKITGVRVSPGGARGPLVEIAWETNDQNLMADPISLEYSVDKTATTWKEIKYRLPPGSPRQDGVGQSRYVGQYTWEVPDENLWKFYVRIRAVDKASNSGQDIWKDEVIVDLEKPAAGITGVRGGNGPAATKPHRTAPPAPIDSDSPPSVPAVPRTPPAKPKPPASVQPTSPASVQPTSPAPVQPLAPSLPTPPGGGPTLPDLPSP